MVRRAPGKAEARRKIDGFNGFVAGQPPERQISVLQFLGRVVESPLTADGGTTAPPG